MNSFRLIKKATSIVQFINKEDFNEISIGRLGMQYVLICWLVEMTGLPVTVQKRLVSGIDCLSLKIISSFE